MIVSRSFGAREVSIVAIDWVRRKVTPTTWVHSCLSVSGSFGARDVSVRREDMVVRGW